MTRYWMSWIEHSEDFRPLTSPPIDAVLGWWKSGEPGEGGGSILVALVEAHSEGQAMNMIAVDWPISGAIREWRFIRNVGFDWRPPGDRFPVSDWMRRRIGLDA